MAQQRADGVRPDPAVVDARGLRCPLPVIRLAAAARAARPGTEITVLWTDPAARHDIPAWARMRGHQLISTEPVPTPTAGPNATAEPNPQTFATTIHLAPTPQPR